MTVKSTFTKPDKVQNEQGPLTKGLKYGLSEYKSHRKVIHQTGILFFSTILGLLIGFAIKVIQTRALGPDGFGLFALFLSVTGFSALFFRFGLFSSIKVLLAGNSDPEKERELFGMGFLMASLIGLSFSLFIFTASFFVDSLFNVNLGATLRLVSPLCFVLPFQFFIPAISIGSNKVGNSALFSVLSKAFFLAPLAILFFVRGVTVTEAILLYLTGFIATAAIILYRLKPLFSGLSGNLRALWKKNKEFGLHLFAGQVADQATHQLDGLMIAFFTNASQLGFYTLTFVICSPMVVFSRALSDSMFKKFASRDFIPRKIIVYNTIWLLGCVVFMLLFSKIIVNLFFGQEFLPVAKYIVPVAAVTFFQGMYQPYNMFLVAKGEKRIGHYAMITSPFNLTGNIILIPIYGVMGAIAASMVTMVLWYYLLMSCYLKRTRKNRK